MRSNNVTSSIPAFIGGVSQQSPALRLRTQCDSLVNGHATVGDGLMQRPNADLVKVLGSIDAPTGMKVHRINRDVSEKYIVIMTTDITSPIRVFDLTGNEKTVRYGTLDADLNFSADANVKQYLTNGGITDAKKHLKAITIKDYTVIVNTQKTCAAKADLTAAAQDKAFVHFHGCHKGSYYITFICSGGNDTTSKAVAYSNGVLNNDSNNLMDEFVNGDAVPNAGLFTTSGNNNVLSVVPAGVNTDVQVKVQDPFGGQDLIPINFCEINSFDKLPAKMPSDVVIKIHGDREIQQDDYYLSYDSDTCVWTETLGFGIKYMLDEDTLPHRLVRTDTDEFTFAPILWEDRTVGDDTTNPMPSFIGQKIDNLVFAKNRLFFVSKENSIGSKAGDYFNFFASTVMDVLDDDPIDVSGGGAEVTHFRSAKPFEGGILHVADEEQFALTSGEQLLTPKTAAIDNTTAYSADPYAEPVKLGADIYFVSPKGSYLSLREYTIVPDTLMKDAYDVTSHVPKYIPQGDVIMDGANALDVLFIHTSADPDSLYVHKFLWDGDKKAQQAWYKWEFADDIYGFVVFGTVMYVIFYDATNGYRLEKIQLENIPYTGQDFRYFQDSLMKLTGGTYGGTDTTFDLDMDVGDGSNWTVIDGDTNLTVTTGFTLANSTLTITGTDASGNTYFVGRDYEMRMRFSEWYMRDGDGNALIAGVLNTSQLTLSFVDTGYFKIEVTPFGRDMNYEEFSDSMSGIRVDESVLGGVTLLSGEETFIIMADSRGTIIELVTDSYLPVALQLGAWEGTFVYEGRIT